MSAAVAVEPAPLSLQGSPSAWNKSSTKSVEKSLPLMRWNFVLYIVEKKKCHCRLTCAEAKWSLAKSKMSSEGWSMAAYPRCTLTFMKASQFCRSYLPSRWDWLFLREFLDEQQMSQLLRSDASVQSDQRRSGVTGNPCSASTLDEEAGWLNLPKKNRQVQICMRSSTGGAVMRKKKATHLQTCRQWNNTLWTHLPATSQFTPLLFISFFCSYRASKLG